MMLFGTSNNMLPGNCSSTEKNMQTGSQKLGTLQIEFTNQTMSLSQLCHSTPPQNPKSQQQALIENQLHFVFCSSTCTFFFDVCALHCLFVANSTYISKLQTETKKKLNSTHHI